MLNRKLNSAQIEQQVLYADSRNRPVSITLKSIKRMPYTHTGFESTAMDVVWLTCGKYGYRLAKGFNILRGHDSRLY